MSDTTMREVVVPLQDRTYSVLIREGLIHQAGILIRERLCTSGRLPRIAVVTDDVVAPLYLDTVLASLRDAGFSAASLILPHGEGTKSLPFLQDVWSFLSGEHITRTDLILALGGGVIGDLTGFAAASWLRGVRFVQLPTSLLAQIDSSVGGKVAIDLKEGKNLVGAFHQPSLVLCDTSVLSTLTDHFWRDGLGEMVKYGCIGEPELFESLEALAGGGRERLMEGMTELVTTCVRHKARVVEQDEHDTGLRVTLNFGHTLAHAVETCQHYQGLSHGMAVAAGMAEITRLSESCHQTEKGTYARLCRLLEALRLPSSLPEIPKEDLLRAMGMDKKHDGSALKIVLLRRIGTCFVFPASTDYFSGIQTA
ncbi:MAG: 3-dehydroquinate synthase [Clostridia bacterium]|nr:3-dehydroquinate synthase [Clostridia bacterium]